jgi:hypothetical protein
MRRLQVEQTAGAARTDLPGVLTLSCNRHDSRPSGVSHTGHTLQVSLTVSPQEGQFNPLFIATMGYPYEDGRLISQQPCIDLLI